MLDSEKVDQFYQLIDSKYYSNWDKPDIILLISPNHFGIVGKTLGNIFTAPWEAQYK